MPLMASRLWVEFVAVACWWSWQARRKLLHEVPPWPTSIDAAGHEVVAGARCNVAPVTAAAGRKQHPVVVIARPACAHCGMKQLRRKKTEKHGAVTIRYFECAACEGTTKAIFE